LGRGRLRRVSCVLFCFVLSCIGWLVPPCLELTGVYVVCVFSAERCHLTIPLPCIQHTHACPLFKRLPLPSTTSPPPPSPSHTPTKQNPLNIDKSRIEKEKETELTQPQSSPPPPPKAKPSSPPTPTKPLPTAPSACPGWCAPTRRARRRASLGWTTWARWPSSLG
jgi:hypothetical protein